MRHPPQYLTQDFLKSVLTYDPATGDFQWVALRTKNATRAGTLDRGYWRIRIRGRAYKAARLAWLYMTGEWPIDRFPDHRNLVRSDDRWANLRLATYGQNNANKGVPSNNSSGAKGVHWDHAKRRYRARLMVNGRRKCIGSFHTLEAASSAYLAAVSEALGEYGRIE